MVLYMWSPPAALGLSLAALYALTPAADKVPYFTSTTAAALATFTALGRSVVGSATVAALWQVITPEALSNAQIATLATQSLSTNVTETTFANSTGNRGGFNLTHTSATATTRISSRFTAGTSVAARVSGGPYNTTGTFLDGGPGVHLSRAGGEVIGFQITQSTTTLRTLTVYQWTSKDTFNASRLADTIGIGIGGHGPIYLRLRETGGNIEAAYSFDGVAYITVYTAAVATAYGSAGATTLAGVGNMLTASGLVSSGYFERLEIV